ncbi:hypothetical protein [Pseudomonas haemolytica]|uniref:Uncharacterized protein n=1 Tax=Pseudomonas haemolytica TaxID=2600065 RepID=A0ABS1H0A2_9PSED|nr:hypothetical protein [Pseudomonas haemolytica]MBK3462663.1 hypothetical protein [Pseudomonas haemolytica]
MLITSSTNERDTLLVSNAQSYKELYMAIIPELRKNRSDDDLFFFIENLLCWMCPKITMCLDDDRTVEVFYNQDSFIEGDFHDLVKLVTSDDFIGIVEAVEPTRYFSLMANIEKYLEWGEEGVVIELDGGSNSL